MAGARRVLIMGAATLLSSLTAAAQGLPSSPDDMQAPEPLVPVVVAALSSAHVVAIGENHGHRELHEALLVALADPRIQAVVDDIVVEFGNALYQPVIDRWIRGSDVPMDSVGLAWRNTVTSPSTVWDSPVYERFFLGVRRINARRSDARAYRLVLGDSPVEWNDVEGLGDLRPFFNRPEHLARVVGREVIAPGRKGILLAGGAHTSLCPMVRTRPDGVRVAEVTAAQLVELRYPDALFTIRSLGRVRSLDHERLKGVRDGAVLRLGDGWLARWPANQISTMGNMDGSPFTLYGDATLSDMADAVIYWRPGAQTFESPAPKTYRDEGYWAELNRRSLMLRGQPMDPELRSGG